MTLFKKQSEMTEEKMPDAYYAALAAKTSTAARETRDRRVLDLAAGIVTVAGDLQFRRRSRAQLRQECDQRGIVFPHSATADFLRDLLKRAVTPAEWAEGERAFDDLIAKMRAQSEGRAIPFSTGVTF